jgi:serine/threonine protein kinase
MTPALLNNRYQVIQTLGAGGFGTTFLAEDTQMPSRRKCVIKQLKPIANNPEIYQLVQERFQREAAILEELGDGNSQIPRLYAYFSEDGLFYLIQEWVEGVTLRDKVQAEGVVTEAIAQQILLDILPVLTYVHDQRIVHRDIKPDNIILRKRDGKPVLIDFGAVRETMGTVVNSQGNSASSIVIGTPGFMPSEQAAGRPMYSSDLYSLGLTMIYMLTARFPQELDLDPRTGDVTWRQYATQVSSTFADLLDKAIQYHPRDRYAMADEMLAALKSSVNAQPNLSVPPTLPPQSFQQRHQESMPADLPSPVPATIISAQTPQTIHQPDQSQGNPLAARLTDWSAKEVPHEILGWNWGAFMMPGLWCLSNQVWIGLIAWTGTFTGTIGWFVAAGLLGAKGNEWAWKSRRWRSVEAFKAHQRTWAIAGSVVWGSIFSLLGVLIVAAIINPEAFETPEEQNVPRPLGSDQLFSPINAGLDSNQPTDGNFTEFFGGDRSSD